MVKLQFETLEDRRFLYAGAFEAPLANELMLDQLSGAIEQFELMTDAARGGARLASGGGQGNASANDLFHADQAPLEPIFDDLPQLSLNALGGSSELVFAANVPALHSNASATVKIFLDFDGNFDASWGSYSNVSTPAFDRDGNAASFSQQELNEISYIYNSIAEDFAPFNVDVTTEDPGNFGPGQSLRIAIGGDGQWVGGTYGGVAYINSYTSSWLTNTAYVFSGNLGSAKSVAEASAHEAGHALGLYHQSTYDGSGNKTSEYNSGNSSWAPNMGVGYYSQVTTWYNGTNSQGSTSYQDDMAVLARSANGFGYRADDHGNDAANASALTVTNVALSGSGVISTNNDADWFSFDTGSGDVSLTVDVAQVAPNLDVTLELRNAAGQVVASAAPSGSLSATLNATLAGGTYYLVVQNNGVYGYVGNYSISGTVQPAEGEPPTDWGVAEFNWFYNENVADGQRFQFTATRTGILTVEAFFTAAQGNVDIQVLDVNSQPVASSALSGDYERLDINATQGATYLLQITGANADVDFRLTNLVVEQGNTVTVNGTAGADSFVFNALTQRHVKVNGVNYYFDASQYTNFVIQGGGGADDIISYGNAGNDTVALRVGSMTQAGAGYQMSTTSVETARVYGQGGDDLAQFYDSSGNDTFEGRSNWAALQGVGFYNYGAGFANVRAYANAGGNDLATFYDSAGNDTFVGRDTWSSLRGASFYNYASGFDDVRAYATAGGTDTAYFNDSAGDDTFVGRDTWSSMRGANYYNYIRGFDAVNAYATAGGNDTAYLHDSAGDDTFIARPTWSSLQGANSSNYVQNFDAVYAYATAGGNDLAQFYDSAGDDRFEGRPTWSSLSGAGFYNYGSGFDNVRAYADAGGTDLALFYDSAGNDTFVGRDTWSSLRGASYYNYIRGFDDVRAFATAGGIDTAYFNDSAGNDTFVGRDTWSSMRGANYYNYIRGFDAVNAYATAGGTDTAYFRDSSSSDLFRATKTNSRLSGAGFNNYAEGFDAVEAQRSSGVDVAELLDANGVDRTETDFAALADYVLSLLNNWS